MSVYRTIGPLVMLTLGFLCNCNRSVFRMCNFSYIPFKHTASSIFKGLSGGNMGPSLSGPRRNRTQPLLVPPGKASKSTGRQSDYLFFFFSFFFHFVSFVHFITNTRYMHTIYISKYNSGKYSVYQTMNTYVKHVMF